MQNRATPSTAALSLGFYAALLTAVLTLITFATALLTPPISGPNCREGCVSYPYLDIVSPFPRDYYWMYPAMVLTLLVVALMVCIHHYTADEKKVFSQIAVCFLLIAATILLVNYFVQVSVIQPSVERGETNGIPLLTQYNSHGLFIALEDIGYLMMTLAFFFTAPVFSGPDRLERALRWIFRLSFILAAMALVALTAQYGTDLEDRFEVIVISVAWLELIVAGVLLSRVFKRALDAAL